MNIKIPAYSLQSESTSCPVVSPSFGPLSNSPTARKRTFRLELKWFRIQASQIAQHILFPDILWRGSLIRGQKAKIENPLPRIKCES